MEARALKKHIRSSPRKMRLVVDLIRGKNAADALSILKFSTQHASKACEMVLRSAVANLSNHEDGKSVNFNKVIVKEAYVDGGPHAKRILPAPMGRAYRVRKRTNHLTIVVATHNEKI